MQFIRIFPLKVEYGVQRFCCVYWSVNCNFISKCHVEARKIIFIPGYISTVNYFYFISIIFLSGNRPVSSVVMTLLSVREVWDSNPRFWQVGNSVANGSPPLRRSFKAVLCCLGAKSQRWPPPPATLRRNTTSIVTTKSWFFFITV